MSKTLNGKREREQKIKIVFMDLISIFLTCRKWRLLPLEYALHMRGESKINGNYLSKV